MILGVALSACGDSDPTISIVRIYDPLGEATVVLEASEPGSPPELARLRWSGIPQTQVQGFEYAVWLMGGSGDPVLAARLRVPRDTTVAPTLSTAALLETASEILVTLEPGDAPPSNGPSQDLRTHRGVAGPVAHAALTTLVGPDMSGASGFAVRLPAQAENIRTNANDAIARADAGDVDGAHSQLEHILNIAEVPPLDHDGDGTVENPDGDDLGLTTLSQRVAELAMEAATAADAWAAATQHGSMAATAADTTGAVLQRLLVVARDALSSSDLFTLRTLTRSVRALSDTLIGDPEAAVSGDCARCGALTAWQQSLAMTALSAEPLESFPLPEAVATSN